MILAIGLVILAAIVCAALSFAVVLGSTAYVSWRTDARDRLIRTDPIARHFFDQYRSPFPWHKEPQSKETKVA